MSNLLPDTAANALEDRSVETIKKLFTTTKIKRIVYVDDHFEKNVDHVIELVAVGKESDKLLAIAGLFPGVNLEDERPVWESDLRNQWSELAAPKQTSLVRQLHELGIVPADVDQEAADALRRLIPDDVEYYPVPPSAWVSGGGEWLEQASADARLLCLFDRELSHRPPDEEIALDGLAMLDDAVRTVGAKSDDYDGRVIFGVYSHKFSISDEQSKGAQISNEKGYRADLFLPISKERRSDLGKLAEGIQLTVLNLYAGAMKGVVKTAMKAACDAAISELDSLDVLDFDDMILHSSLREGVWEGETLLRLFLLLQQREGWKGLATQAIADKFNAQVRIAREIADPRLARKESNDKLFNLRKLELYEEGNSLNGFHAPLRLGDIFEATTKYRYILLAPPCDLMVRSHSNKGPGLRSANLKAELFRIADTTDEKAKELSANELSVCAFLKHYKKGKLGRILFKERLILPIEILDLAVLNNEGACRIDLANPPAMPAQFQPAWQARHGLLLTHFQEFAKPLVKLAPLLADQELNADTCEALGKIKSSYLNPSGMIPKAPTFQNDVLDFQLKRVAHYRTSVSQHLLTAYAHFVSRPAEEHDFSAVQASSSTD